MLPQKSQSQNRLNKKVEEYTQDNTMKNLQNTQDFINDIFVEKVNIQEQTKEFKKR